MQFLNSVDTRSHICAQPLSANHFDIFQEMDTKAFISEEKSKLDSQVFKEVAALHTLCAFVVSFVVTCLADECYECSTNISFIFCRSMTKRRTLKT